MLMAHGFLARLFAMFEQHETSVDMVSTSEVSVSVTLDDARNLAGLVADLRALGEVTVEREQAAALFGWGEFEIHAGTGRAYFCEFE